MQIIFEFPFVSLSDHGTVLVQFIFHISMNLKYELYNSYFIFPWPMIRLHSKSFGSSDETSYFICIFKINNCNCLLIVWIHKQKLWHIHTGSISLCIHDPLNGLTLREHIWLPILRSKFVTVIMFQNKKISFIKMNV